MTRFTRGDWEPLIPMRYRWPILALLGVTPILVGLDYLLGENGDTLSEVERAAPLWAWGSALMLAGLAIGVGYVMRWPKWAIGGLHGSAVLFAVLSIGIAVQTVDWNGGHRGPWLYAVIALASWWAAMGYAIQAGGGK